MTALAAEQARALIGLRAKLWWRRVVQGGHRAAPVAHAVEPEAPHRPQHPQQDQGEEQQGDEVDQRFPVRQDDQPGQDQSLSRAVVESIVYYVARTSVASQSTWPIDTSSQQFLGLIADWESLRLAGEPDQRLINRPDQLASADLPGLASLWTLPPMFTQRLAEQRWLEASEAAEQAKAG